MEDALRARAKAFYECYLTGKFRQADDYVAPDSKDAYFNAEKERYRSYKISRIKFNDNNQTAELMVIVGTNFNMQGKLIPVDVPIVAHWKVVDGQWFWYHVPRNYTDTPFGRINKQTDAEKNAPRTDAKTDQRKQSPRAIMAAFSAMPSMVKPVLTLSPENKFADSTALMNPSGQRIKFHVESTPVSGLMIRPSAAEILPGKSIQLEAVYAANRPGAMPQKTDHRAYLVLESGSKMEFRIDIVPRENARR